MADTKMNQNQSNEQLRSEANKAEGSQAMRHEQAKGQVSGERDEKSAIGGGDHRSQTGEPGRARDELNQGRDRQPGQDQSRSEFGKNRSETAGSR